mgnify:CR=1 FL=1
MKQHKLIAMGVLGVLPPAASALLHNLSALIKRLHSITFFWNDCLFGSLSIRLEWRRLLLFDRI